MSIKTKLLQFARLLRCFNEVQTDRGLLIADTDLVVGTEVFTNTEAGELVPAPSGVYVSGETTFTVEAGVITAVEIKPLEEPIVEEPIEVELEEPVVEEPTVDTEKEALKLEVEELKAEIETLKETIKKLEEELNKPVEEPIEETPSQEVFNKNKKLEALRQAFKK